MGYATLWRLLRLMSAHLLWSPDIRGDGVGGPAPVLLQNQAALVPEAWPTLHGLAIGGEAGVGSVQGAPLRGLLASQGSLTALGFPVDPARGRPPAQWAPYLL